MKKSAVLSLAVLSVTILSLVRSAQTAQIAGRFLRGDANGDGRVAMSDAITTLQALFLKSAPLNCEDAADANDDGALNLGDPVFTLYWLYRGGAAPPAPGASACGDDPTVDSLGPCVASFCPSEGGTGDDIASLEISLPEDRLDEVRTSFSQGRIAQALELALNSAGDSITLSIKVNASVAIVAALNVGGEVSFEAKIARTEDGFYEVSIARETVMTAGVEIMEGLEANIGNSVGLKAIFRFQSIDEIARSLEQIGTALVLNPARGAALQVLGHTADLLASIQGMLGQAAQFQALLGDVESQLQQLQGAVAKLNSAINSAQSELNSVLDKLADILGDVIGFFDKDLKKRLEAQKSKLESNIAAWNNQRGALFQQIANSKALKSQYESALAQIRAAIATAQASVGAARESVEVARRAIEALDLSQSSLKLHGAAFELTFSRKANLEAELSPFPGASIEGMTLGASVDTSLGITGRLDLGNDGKPSKLALSVSGQLTLSGGVSMGVGLEGDVKAGVDMTVTFKKENGRYQKVDGKATLTVDAEVLPSIGGGFVVHAGAGRKVSIKMDLAQLLDRRDAVKSLFTSGDVQALARAFASLTATVKIEDRWIAQAEFGFGYSLAGNGAAAEGNATWADVNHVTAADVEAGSLLREITDPARIQTVLQGLVNQIVPIAP